MIVINYICGLSLPNGKLLQHNDSIYQSNMLKLLNQTDYNNLISTFNNALNNISVTGNFTVTVGYSLSANKSVSLGFKPILVLLYSEGNDRGIPLKNEQQSMDKAIRIITSATSALSTANALITSSGFTASFSNDTTGTETVYYIAFK